MNDRVETTSDLVVLVADQRMKFSIESLLGNRKLVKGNIAGFEIFSHTRHDPGCYRDGHNFLRLFCRTHKYCLVILDREGCGREEKKAEAIEQEIETNLKRNGWPNRSAAIVIDPELEIWAWYDPKQLETILELHDSPIGMKEWFLDENLWKPRESKPFRPKEALEALLRRNRIPASSANYSRIAENISVDHCEDRAFQKLREVLASWFPTIG